MQDKNGGVGGKWLSVPYLCMVLAIVSLGIYANTLQNGYVLDDGMVLSHNSIVAKGIKGIPELLVTPRTAGAEMDYTNEFYRPLSMVMFAIEVQLFGLNPMVGHLVNILAFAGCVLLLFLFLDGLFYGSRRAVAFIAALLFAVHPIHTEVVANIKSRDELMCYLFAFWSLLLFVRYMQGGKVGRLVGGIVALFLAYLSKETVIAFVVVIPLVFFFYRNDNRKRAMFITGGAMAATIVFMALRTMVLSKYATNEDAAVSFMENALAGAPDAVTRLATAFAGLGKYLALLFVPYPLLCSYAYNSIPYVGFTDWRVLLSIAAYVALAYFGVSRLIKNRKDPWAFAILFYLATLALFSNIPFLVGAQLAERFLFFASTGFCLAVALAAERWLFVKGMQGGVAAIKSPRVLLLLIPVLLVFGTMTVARNADWKDNYTLYKTDVEKSPDDSRLHEWLAAEIAENLYVAAPDASRKKELEREAIGYLERALAIHPGYAQAHTELGLIYERSGQYDKAEYHDKMALQLEPGNSLANSNLGSLYYSAGRYTEAIVLLQRAIAANPRMKIAYLTLANCYVHTRQYDLAINNSEAALSIAPDDADAHQVAGNAYLKKQSYGEAEAHFVTAIKLKPGYVHAINNLGVVYLNSKRFEEAIVQFKKATTLNPRYASAYSNLGRAYYFSGQYEQAIAAIKWGLRLDPENTGDIPILALCYQKVGKTDLAKQYEEKAKQVYPNFKLE